MQFTETVDAAEFGRWLRLGLGRAVLYLQSHDSKPYRGALLDACLNDLSYDAQAGDDRAPYLYDLIQASGELPLYRDHVISSLQTSRGDSSERQIFALARRLAQAGDASAKQIIYEAFAQNAAQQHYAGASELIALDGVDGFIFVAQHLTSLDPEEDDWLPSAWIDDLEERDGKEAAWSALDRASGSVPEIAPLLDLVKRERAASSPLNRSPQPPVDYPTLRAEIERKGERTNGLWAWGKAAADESIAEAARDLNMEQDRGRLLAYMKVFSRRAFPLEPDRLLELAQSEDKMLAWRTCHVLEIVAHPKVRELAVKFAEMGSYTEATMLLKANAQDGDAKRILSWLELTADADDLHVLAMTARGFAEANWTEESADCLFYMYERGPCPMCRCSCVEMLDKRGLVPAWMRKECCWDAEDELRKWAAGESETR